MAFGYKSDPAIRYEYHCRQMDRETEKKLIDQIFQAHRFQNNLIRIELDRREAVRQSALKISPDLELVIAELERRDAEIDLIVAELMAARILAKKRTAGKDIADRLRTAKAERQPVYARRKAARHAAYRSPEGAAAIEVIEAETAVKNNEAYQEAVQGGLYWPTTLDVIKRINKSGPQPKFRRFDGSGAVALQFQRKGEGDEEECVLNDKGEPVMRRGKPVTRRTKSKPMGPEQLFAGNTILKINRMPAKKGDPTSGDSRKWVMIDWRIGSEGKRKSPVFLKIGPVAMHRPLPVGCTIKWAHLHRERIGTRFRWSVQFTITKEAWEPKPRAASGLVSVALGWSMVDGDLRVGCWAASDGTEGDIRIPADKLGRWRLSDQLRSTRDLQLNVMRDKLLSYLQATGGFVDRETELPAEFLERLSHLHMWKSPGRMGRFLAWWRANRFPGDEVIFSTLDGGFQVDGAGKVRYTLNSVRQDRHLYDWQEFSRRSGKMWRKNLYRHTAAGFSKRYKEAVVADIDWGELGKNRADEDIRPEVSKTNKGAAAVASFRDCLAVRLDLQPVPAPWTTMGCHRCGTICKPLKGRWIACESCGGEPMDRAVNAARNLLRFAVGRNIF